MRRAGGIFCLLALLLPGVESKASDSGAVNLADSLNMAAVSFLPVNLDSAQSCAMKSFEMSPKRSSARAEACNTLGDIAFARMNYTEAANRYQDVLNNSRNRVEWLWADVGMMNICQRISDNMSFYQYRDRALLELRGIRDEAETLPEHSRRRAWMAETDLRLVSATYFYVVEQDSLARTELMRVGENDALHSDTLRYLRWNTLKGTGGLHSSTFERRVNYIGDVHRMAVRNGFLCQSALTYQAMAQLLIDAGDEVFEETDIRTLMTVSPYGMNRLMSARQLSLAALQQFLHYGSLYGAVETYCQIGSCANEAGEFEEALEWLGKALDMLNTARDIAVPDAGDIPYLEMYRTDTLVVENVWVELIPLAAVPECMSRIREQISMAYSGLGDKLASDYNRDVYLELQKTIRLDRRYEARQQLLRRMNSSLNVALMAVILGLALMVVAILLLVRTMNRRNRVYADMMEKVMDICSRILSVRPSQGESIDDCVQRILETDDAGIIRGNKALMDMVSPYIAAARQNADTLADIGDRQNIAIREHGLALASQKENLRQNLIRRTCCSVMSDCLPLIDRMVGESSKLRADDAGLAGHLDYISELAGRTEQYNNVLAGWTRMCQGEVSLHIENFELQPLLDLLRRGERSFVRSGISFNVADTEAVVRADRVLTLFMLNTLADNARKFTPSGGRVSVEVSESEGCVELSVCDTGIGLCEEDVRRLMSGKVWNPRQIGANSGSTQSKGEGFGLMNCRGIIDKYRSLGTPFDCCRFGVESTLGKGSRFSFRLPAGVRRALSILVILAASVTANADDTLLESAYQYADSVYECNLRRDHQQALEYASVAMQRLSEDYRSLSGDDSHPMELMTDGAPAEQIWLDSGFATDYETILWIRNEVAVAALAIQDMELYKFNDDAYLTLFRMYYSEDVIESDCSELIRSNSNIRIAIVLLILLVLVVVVSQLMLRSRHWLRYRSDMQQILKVTGNISELLTDAASRGEYDMQELSDRLMDTVLPDLRQMAPVEAAEVLLNDEGGRCSSVRGHAGRDTVRREFPLRIPDSNADVGMLSVWLRNNANEADVLACGMIARYMAVSVHSCLMRMSAESHSLAQLREDSERLEYEDGRLHVQNMVLDNCLSTLRHETLSYPARILKLAGRMKSGADDESVSYMRELVLYYREIYDILSRNVRRQADDVFVRVERTDVAALVNAVCDRFRQKSDGHLRVSVASQIPDCMGDAALLEFLLDSLLAEASADPAAGDIRLVCAEDGDFLRIALEDNRITRRTDNPEMMFTPLWKENNMHYSLCRQIIREMDEAMGHPGCRINAENRRDGGLLIWFGLPLARE